MHRQRSILFSMIFGIIAASTRVVAQTDAAYNLILMTETSVVAARLLSDELTESRYLLIGVRVMMVGGSRPFTTRTDEIYAIDCRSPRRFKAISIGVNLAKDKSDPDNWINMKPENVPEKFRLDELSYVDIDLWNKQIKHELRLSGAGASLPEAVSVSAEYGCAAIGTPASMRDQLRERVIRSGAQPDLRELQCKYSFDSLNTYMADIGFSEFSGAIRWNDRWMLGTYVNERELGMTGQNISAIIDRRTGAIRVTVAGQVAGGTCEVAIPTTRKF